ncbi:hypothetical protein MM239_20860, partial [Belliella sp. DSM 111904]|nr:hypothetical protein [Belliella filtrata]
MAELIVFRLFWLVFFHLFRCYHTSLIRFIKITNSSEKITPFGGFNFVIESFKNSGLSMLIDNHLGSRVKTV